MEDMRMQRLERMQARYDEVICQQNFFTYFWLIRILRTVLDLFLLMEFSHSNLYSNLSRFNSKFGLVNYELIFKYVIRPPYSHLSWKPLSGTRTKPFKWVPLQPWNNMLMDPTSWMRLFGSLHTLNSPIRGGERWVLFQKLFELFLVDSDRSRRDKHAYIGHSSGWAKFFELGICEFWP